VGAGRPQLVRQFLGEAVLIATLALPVALGLAQLALPVVNDVAGTTLRLGDVPLSVGLGAALGLVALVGLGAGSYPALVLARFRPAEVLMQTGRSAGRGRSTWLRKGLVVAQFAASVALVLATLVVHAQLDYVQTKQLGFDEERVITFDKGPLDEQYAAFKEALQQQTAVTSVSAGPPPGIGHKNMTTSVTHPETGAEQTITTMFVDVGYIETLGLTLERGRSFTPDRSGDVNRSVVLTESAVVAYGVEDNPVGQQIPWGNQQRTVIGVVNDFHNESLHEVIQPVVLVLDPESTWTAMARLAPGATEAGLDGVRTTWSRFLPDRPFTFSFLDQRVEAQYRAEQRLATLFGGFAGLAVLVAALGLVGLAAFMAQQRTKEIGIRKALGASVASIVGLLSREFVALVAVAIGLGAPVAYWAMQQWMQNFAFQARMGVGLFLAVGAVTLAVTLLAVGYHATRAALTDPAITLRDE
jgi:putative ABC transport system permease protein